MSTSHVFDKPRDYFDSYEDFEVHRLMLSDKPRMEAYKRAIISNQLVFKDSVVMDVGAGTGILSMFCASTGAKKVYAVEASSVACIASRVIKENGYSDIIEVIHQKVEDLSFPDEIKVDIIVSEWMGFYLLHESMLDSVIFARDNFLKPSGRLFPDTAKIFAAPCSIPSSLRFEMQKGKEFWTDVCGFKMRSIGDLIEKERYKSPEVSTMVEKGDLLCSGIKLFTLDLAKVTVNELDSLEVSKFVSVDRNGEYGGLCIWFECEFPILNSLDEGSINGIIDSSSLPDQKNIILSTSPLCSPTHWKQTLVIWPQETVESIMEENVLHDDADEKTKSQESFSSNIPQKWILEDGEIVGFKLSLRRDQACPRRYAIHLEALDPTEEEHPVPCECGSARCTVIAAFLGRNDESSDSSFSTDGECDIDET